MTKLGGYKFIVLGFLVITLVISAAWSVVTTDEEIVMMGEAPPHATEVLDSCAPRTERCERYMNKLINDVFYSSSAHEWRRGILLDSPVIGRRYSYSDIGNYCVGENERISNRQVELIFLKWLSEHPERLHERPFDLLVSSLVDTLPCSRSP